MKIETIKITSMTVYILFLDDAEENSKINLNTMKSIIELGNEFVCAEGIDLTSYNQWQQHSFQLFKGVNNDRYMVRNLNGVDIALKKFDFYILIDEIWKNRNIFLTFLDEGYLPFSLSHKMNGFGPEWKKAYGMLKTFKWNLQLLISERSYFSSPYEKVIQEIINILGIEKHHG